MPEDTSTPAAVVDLAANLAEFDTPPGATEPPQDEFLAEFSDIVNPSAEPPGTDPTPEPAAEPAPEPTPAPPAATPPADPDEIPTELPGKPSEAAKNHWKKLTSAHEKTKSELQTERETRAREVAERDAELATLRKQVANLPELSEKAKLAEEAERELAIARVEGTREYKQTILAPLEAIEKAATALAEKNEVKVDAILDVLTESDPDKQRDMLDELVSGMRTVDQLAVVRMAEDARQLLTRREQIRERAVEARRELEEITARKETETAAANRKLYEGEVDRYAKELKARIPFVPLAEGETADAVFEVLREKASAADYDKAAPGTKAFAAFAAVALPRATKQLVRLQEEIRTLKARIAEGRATAPTVGTPAPAAPPPDHDEEGDFMSGFADLLPGMMRSHNITKLVQ